EKELRVECRHPAELRDIQARQQEIPSVKKAGQVRKVFRRLGNERDDAPFPCVVLRDGEMSPASIIEDRPWSRALHEKQNEAQGPESNSDHGEQRKGSTIVSDATADLLKKRKRRPRSTGQEQRGHEHRKLDSKDPQDRKSVR